MYFKEGDMTQRLGKLLPTTRHKAPAIQFVPTIRLEDRAKQVSARAA